MSFADAELCIGVFVVIRLQLERLGRDLFRPLRKLGQAQFLIGEVEVNEETGEDVSADQPILADHGTFIQHLDRAILELEAAHFKRVGNRTIAVLQSFVADSAEVHVGQSRDAGLFSQGPVDQDSGGTGIEHEFGLVPVHLDVKPVTAQMRRINQQPDKRRLGGARLAHQPASPVRVLRTRLEKLQVVAHAGARLFIIVVVASQIFLQELDALFAAQLLHPSTPDLGIRRVERMCLFNQVPAALVHRDRPAYACQAQIGVGLLASRIDDLDPFRLGICDLPLPKKNFSERDMHRYRIGHRQRFRGRLGGLLHVFHLEIGANDTGVGIGRLRFLSDDLLIDLQRAIEVAFLIKNPGIMQRAQGRGYRRGHDRCCGGGWLRCYVRRGRSGLLARSAGRSRQATKSESQDCA